MENRILFISMENLILFISMENLAFASPSLSLSSNGICFLFVVESPVGVGHSYSTSPSTDFHMTDEETAADNYEVLVAFFKAFPEYSKNDFYVM